MRITWFRRSLRRLPAGFRNPRRSLRSRDVMYCCAAFTTSSWSCPEIGFARSRPTCSWSFPRPCSPESSPERTWRTPVHPRSESGIQCCASARGRSPQRRRERRAPPVRHEPDGRATPRRPRRRRSPPVTRESTTTGQSRRNPSDPSAVLARTPSACAVRGHRVRLHRRTGSEPPTAARSRHSGPTTTGSGRRGSPRPQPISPMMPRCYGLNR